MWRPQDCSIDFLNVDCKIWMIQNDCMTMKTWSMMFFYVLITVPHWACTLVLLHVCTLILILILILIYMVDYCSACGVVHVVPQRTLRRECLQEKHVGAERWDIYNHHHLCQTNKWRQIIEAMTNKWKMSYLSSIRTLITFFVASDKQLGWQKIRAYTISTIDHSVLSGLLDLLDRWMNQLKLNL